MKFINLKDIYYRYYNNNIFYIYDGESIEIYIDGRIIVDIIYFRKINPNYFKPIIINFGHKLDFSVYFELL